MGLDINTPVSVSVCVCVHVCVRVCPSKTASGSFSLFKRLFLVDDIIMRCHHETC